MATACLGKQRSAQLHHKVKLVAKVKEKAGSEVEKEALVFSCLFQTSSHSSGSLKARRARVGIECRQHRKSLAPPKDWAALGELVAWSPTFHDWGLWWQWFDK